MINGQIMVKSMINGQMKGQMNGQWSNEGSNEVVNGQMNGQMNGQIHGHINGQIPTPGDPRPASPGPHATAGRQRLRRGIFWIIVILSC